MFSFKKIINITLIVFVIAFVCFVCFKKSNSIELISGDEKTLQVYEWWHIESFEGGSANRGQYLKNLALEYEKSNPTALFMVTVVQDDELEQRLTQSTPDLISFTEQTATTILPYLNEINKEYNIQDNYLESAKFNGKLMAIPYIASGYCYFTKDDDDSNIYTGNANKHNATSLVNSSINDGSTLTQYECYTKFVNNKGIKLLGTARDLHRIKHLEEIGRLSANYEMVNSFTDLIQYLGVIKPSAEITKFVDFVMQDNNQLNLSKLGLFSTKHLTLYSNPPYSDMETAIKSCYVPNIFNS